MSDPPPPAPSATKKQAGKFRPIRGKKKSTTLAHSDDSNDDSNDTSPTKEPRKDREKKDYKDKERRPPQQLKRGKTTMGALSASENMRASPGSSSGTGAHTGRLAKKSGGALAVGTKAGSTPMPSRGDGVETIVGEVVREERKVEPTWSDDSDSEEEDGNRVTVKGGGKDVGGGGKKGVNQSEAYTYYGSGDEDSDEDENPSTPVEMSVDLASSDARFEPKTISTGLDGDVESPSSRDHEETNSIFPFIMPSASVEEMEKEADGFFLMKFPTRLPRLEVDEGTRGTVTAAGADMEALGLHRNRIEPPPEGEELRFRSEQDGPGDYDESFAKTPAGQYGRVEMYASGRCYLVLGGGAGGGPEVRLELEEGIDVGFKQEAVIVDTDLADEQGEGGIYHKLGDITKTVVVCPVLEDE